MTTDSGRMANRTKLIIPPNGFSLTEAGQITHGTVIQTGGVIQYAGQQLGTTNQLQQNPQVGRFEKFIKAETKSLLFIASGSLSVVLEKQLFTRMVKCSMGMNITGAVIAFIGMILYSVEWLLNSVYSRQNDDLSRSVGTGLAALLLMFSFLEFCIAASMAHYQFQAVCCNSDMTIVCVPYVVNGEGAFSTEDVLPETNPVPPVYGNVALLS
ncbi:membrane-spanning 4-domains subfamily A member 12-like isoform X2 [Eublepharis macularius]|uniref:Membrane-spanning 4-domains subfamily A member 12-like isoform X2 n=1 Tax=Eublepharis macularius TaxID=481883 RepID=A0AA97IVG2_EUBMA|nr:membrane-spanning 4-domains subfamily A member 12-like isoform X2 [Eublepharis macularius]